MMEAIKLREFDRYFRNLLGSSGASRISGADRHWLLALRENALDDLNAQGMPTVKTEAWKYTTLTGLLKESFSQADPQALVDVPGDLTSQTVVVVNGEIKRELSSLTELHQGVSVRGLNDVLANDPEALKGQFGVLMSHDKYPFAAMNSAGFSDGLVIEVSPGTVVEEPLVVLWMVAGRDKSLVQPRLFLRLGEGAQLTLIERHLSSPTSHLVNRVGEIDVGENARLTHVQMQQTGASRLIQSVHVRCRRDSRYRGQNLDFGSDFVRNDLVVSLEGTGAESDIDGLFMASRNQHVDNHIRIDHRVPHCMSRALYKGLLGDRGEGVFNGKLIVHPGADKTDARQVNHNLLLSPKVNINSKPELEIYTDDVKCSHGSTTGELDTDQLFYLLARGIGKADAQHLLVAAFAREIRERLPLGDFDALIDGAVNSALSQLTVGQGET